MQPSSPWVGSTSALSASSASSSLPGLALNAPTTMTSGMTILLAETAGSYEGGSAVSLRINHVSVNALDLQRSTDFYIELLGAEQIATPNFGLPVQWLALGRTQLHLFERDMTPTSHHHFGVTVDDVGPVYRVAERWNAFDDEAFRNRLVELPGDIVQLYLRDPAGNLSRSTTRVSTGSRMTCGAAHGPVGVQPAGRRADERPPVRAGVIPRWPPIRSSPRSRSTSTGPTPPTTR